MRFHAVAVPSEGHGDVPELRRDPVRDLERSLRFYRDAFGLHEVARGDNWKQGAGVYVLLRDARSGQKLERLPVRGRLQPGRGARSRGVPRRRSAGFPAEAPHPRHRARADRSVSRGTRGGSRNVELVPRRACQGPRRQLDRSVRALRSDRSHAAERLWSRGSVPRAETFFPSGFMVRASRGNSVWESARLKISKSPVRARPAA